MSIKVTGTDITGEYNPANGHICLASGLRVIHRAIIAMWCHSEVVMSYIGKLKYQADGTLIYRQES